MDLPQGLQVPVAFFAMAAEGAVPRPQLEKSRAGTALLWHCWRTWAPAWLQGFGFQSAELCKDGGVPGRMGTIFLSSKDLHQLQQFLSVSDVCAVKPKL